MPGSGRAELTEFDATGAELIYGVKKRLDGRYWRRTKIDGYGCGAPDAPLSDDWIAHEVSYPKETAAVACLIGVAEGLVKLRCKWRPGWTA